MVYSEILWNRLLARISMEPRIETEHYNQMGITTYVTAARQACRAYYNTTEKLAQMVCGQMDEGERATMRHVTKLKKESKRRKVSLQSLARSAVRLSVTPSMNRRTHIYSLEHCGILQFPPFPADLDWTLVFRLSVS